MYSVESSGLIMLTTELYKYSAIQMKERRERKREIILFIFVLLLSHSVMSHSLQSYRLQHSRLPCLSLSLWICSDSHPLSRRCYQIISSSATFFFFCLQSFPASRSFPMSQLFTSGGQSIGASASSSVLQMNIQGWFPLGLEASPAPQFEGLNSSALSLLYGPTYLICTWLLEKL